MDQSDQPGACALLTQFVEAFGRAAWTARIASIRRGCVPGYAGRALAQMHALELTLDRLRRTGAAPATPAETRIVTLARDLARLMQALSPAGQTRLRAAFAASLQGSNTLVPLFHLAACARTQTERGFSVHFAGLQDGATFDLLLSRDGVEAELVCEVVSAEDGRDLQRGAWSSLADRVDADLQSWLSAHPGRYLLKMTLPRGLKDDAAAGSAALGDLHQRITRLLTERRRVEHDEAAVLRLEPLLLAGAQAGESGLLRGLRQTFGPEAHLAVTAAGTGVFVMAARAAREDEVAVAVQRRMAAIAPARLTGTRPGILAMFIEDTDRLEWRRLRDQLQLEGAARQFLTRPEAVSVIVVTCASRMELLGATPPDAAVDGELRFRNPTHKLAKALALAPSVVSTH